MARRATEGAENRSTPKIAKTDEPVGISMRIDQYGAGFSTER